MRQTTDYIVIHCSATPPSMNIGAHEIDRWHRQKGWLKIGYHFVITREGVVQKGRDLNEIGAHVKGHNHHSIGICMVGGVAERREDGQWPGEPPTWRAENNFTDVQWRALIALVREMHRIHTDAKVVGHRDLEPHKECPSFDVAEWLTNMAVLQAA